VATKKPKAEAPKKPPNVSSRKSAAAKAAGKKLDAPQGLTEKEEKFCNEYMLDLNATQAYSRSFDCKNLRTAATKGSALLKKVDISSRIDELRATRNQRLEVEADEVLRGYLNRVRADPRDLVEYRRGACRYCHGDGHRYHYTPGEFERAMEKHQLAKTEDPDLPDFDPQGGVGFDPRKTPHAECPECFGEGEGRVVFKDTRLYGEKALALYAGFEIGKDGIKCKINSQDDALEKVARHTGFFEKDNKQSVVVSVPTEELDEIYRRGVENSEARKVELSGRGERVRSNVGKG
jgi:hypothetical protein